MIFMIVGIVGFQGDVQEHVKSLRRAGRSRKLQVRPIRRPEDIDGISGLLFQEVRAPPFTSSSTPTGFTILSNLSAKPASR
jgi:Predicted glutamine amidotransferase involved in pyridoxine biosynthesis